eukprot:UC1_evm2s523
MTMEMVKRTRREKRDARTAQAKRDRVAALDAEGMRRTRVRVRVTDDEVWSFPLQPHPRRGYGGQGLARKSVWLAMNAAAGDHDDTATSFLDAWTAVFNEHVNWGKRGNAFMKAVKRERDANMLWRQRLRDKMEREEQDKQSTTFDSAPSVAAGAAAVAVVDSVDFVTSSKSRKNRKNSKSGRSLVSDFDVASFAPPRRKDIDSRARKSANAARRLAKRTKGAVNITEQQHAIEAYRRHKAARAEKLVVGSSIGAVPSRALKGHRSLDRFD